MFDSAPDWISPLTPGVQIGNLSRSEDGHMVRVGLGEDWPRMFRHMASLGKGFVLTRNESAILGRRTTYPELSATSSGENASDGKDGLWVDFRHLVYARAVHTRLYPGHAFGIEFVDDRSRAIHRFSLTPESDADAFFDWVRLHQACPAETQTRLENTEESADDDLPLPLRGADPGALVSILAACCERSLRLEVTLASAAVRHRAEITPDAIVKDTSWWFTSDEDTGLHFDPELLTSVELVSQGAGRALRCVSEEHAAALMIKAAPGTCASDWVQVLEDLL